MNDAEPKPTAVPARDEREDDPGPERSEADDPAVALAAEPMSLSLMGKLFGVPLLIIGSIVGCAVVVVVLFGAPASPEARSVESLLQALEASSWGYDNGVVLLPREKEPWQAALELAVRLEGKNTQVSSEELTAITDRIGKLITGDLESMGHISATGPRGSAIAATPSTRLQFLIQALGRTNRDGALDPLIQVVRSGREPYVCAAIHQLGNLYALPGSRRAIGPIIEALASSPPVETRLMACTALSVLANPNDQEVVEALAAQRLAGEAEVAWSAALALARLGSDEGKITLLDLLDRSFWESGERYVVQDESGGTHRYRMPGERVQMLLIAAVDAAAHLDDPDLWAAINALAQDVSPAVRARAMAALAQQNTERSGRADSQGKE